MERKHCTKCKKIVISKIVMIRISSTLRRTTRTLISTSPAFLTKRWNALKASTFMTWFRESKVNHKKKQFRMISNNINHSIPSAQSQKLRLWLLGTLNYARLSTWSRSGNARHVLSIAVQELKTAHVDILWQKILPRIECTSQLCLIRSPYRTSTSESTGHTVTGMEKHLDVKITIRRINLQRKCRKKKYDSIHDRFIRDKTFRKATIEVGRSEQMIIEMDKLASEDHTYKANKEEIEFYRGNWWIHTNVVHFDSVPTRYEPEFKNALSTLQRLKRAEDKKKQETVTQNSSSSSSWHWHASWWESDFEHSPQKIVWLLIAQGNLFLGGSISICGKSLNVQKNLEFLPWISRLQLTAVYCHRRWGVKGMYPAPDIHEHFTIHKWLRQTA